MPRKFGKFLCIVAFDIILLRLTRSGTSAIRIDLPLRAASPEDRVAAPW
jgi:hypothetical protein